MQEVCELQEQVRDLMFYLNAKDKLQEVSDVSQEEIQGGQIVIGEASASSSDAVPSKPRKKKNR